MFTVTIRATIGVWPVIFSTPGHIPSQLRVPRPSGSVQRVAGLASEQLVCTKKVNISSCTGSSNHPFKTYRVGPPTACKFCGFVYIWTLPYPDVSRRIWQSPHNSTCYRGDLKMIIGINYIIIYKNSQTGICLSV